MVTVYQAILAQLSSFDLGLLKYVLPFDRPLDLNKTHTIAGRNISYFDLSNLIRLGLVEEVKSYHTKISSSWNDEPAYLSVMENKAVDYVVTAFGSEFIDACKR